MSSPDTIIEVIDAWPNGICDACLEELTDADSHQYINATCRNLEKKGYLDRQKNERIACGHCGKVRVLNTRRERPQMAMSNLKATSRSPLLAVDADFMDRLRRAVIQYLNLLDPGSEREGFSRRVQDLRNRDLIPGTLASLFLTHAAYRNQMYYKSFQPSDSEKQILLDIDAHIRTNLSTLTLRL